MTRRLSMLAAINAPKVIFWSSIASAPTLTIRTVAACVSAWPRSRYRSVACERARDSVIANAWTSLQRDSISASKPCDLMLWRAIPNSVSRPSRCCKCCRSSLPRACTVRDDHHVSTAKAIRMHNITQATGSAITRINPKANTTNGKSISSSAMGPA